MLILKKKKKEKKKRKEKVLNTNTNSALETRLESTREYAETPKIENPRPKSFFFVSTPI